MPDISSVSKTYRIFLQLLLTISIATNFNRATMSDLGFCCSLFSLCQPLVLYCLVSTPQLEYSFLLLGQIMSLLCSKLCDRSSFHSDKKSQVPYNLFFHYCFPISLFQPSLPHRPLFSKTTRHILILRYFYLALLSVMLFSQTRGSQSMVPKPAPSASPTNSTEMQILRPHRGPTKSGPPTGAQKSEL